MFATDDDAGTRRGLCSKNLGKRYKTYSDPAQYSSVKRKGKREKEKINNLSPTQFPIDDAYPKTIDCRSARFQSTLHRLKPS
ncbi:MAG TPA: hypothetical protein DCL61_11320 [Cyanobacteria bacterium UBA12227]|nr:hypothetical protein [Cyanobacteria bacterium UBA12227]HAX89678.1 hypothetical protein [Cyanobacteria bacterium UBA11370]HBY76941.1 hypothetical protein [Cyanobacteria bacterium UBA11148]